jgi:translation initiation factor 5B
MTVRQPIVSVLGHVDHGKTTFLDYIRGSNVVKREFGAITQHIGATEVPIATIKDICGDMVGKFSVDLPGLLFIDTPGHHSFTTLRARGGALADMAVLMIDINEGIMPQTVESINILKQLKTPFLVVANKVDRINGWKVKEGESFMASFQTQHETVQETVDDKLYKLIGQFTEKELNADRFDRISDFTKTFAIIPASVRYGEGIPEILMMLMGLAQRFLGDALVTEDVPGEGTILEVKEEKGLGTTLDTIIYNGVVNEGATIVVGTKGEPIVTTIRALLKPKALDEIRDPREKFTNVKEVSAAAGVKIVAKNLEGVVSGAEIKVVVGDPEDVIKDLKEAAKIDFTYDENGVILKADAIGSLEALVAELNNIEVPLRKVEVGDISARDIKEASMMEDPLKKIILSFNVKVLPEAKETLDEADITVFESNIIYKLLEDYEKWYKETKAELDKEARGDFSHPGQFKILSDYIFRVSKPAVVGVRVLAGRIRVGQQVLRDDGEVVGRIKSIQKDKHSQKEAIMGEEVAISIKGPTVGRQIKGDEVYLIDLRESTVKQLRAKGLSVEELDLLDKVCQIKRKSGHVGWGM